MRHRAPMIAALLATAYLVGPSAEADHFTSPGSNGRVLYLRECYPCRWDYSRLIVINEDGSANSAITSDRFDIYDAHWSPAGNRIVYSRYPLRGRGEEEIQIAVTDSDGTRTRRLTKDHFDREAVWSPDGKWIAFDRDEIGRSREYNDIFLIRPKGTRRHNITHNINRPRYADLNQGGLTWSPDSTRIAFCQGGAFDAAAIGVANADGSGYELLTARDTSCDPTWSPDGTMIAFDRGGTGDGVWVMNADGTGQTRIARNRMHPEWSPDGSKLLFTDIRNYVYTMNPDGSEKERLVKAWYAGWSPDGTKIMFSRARSLWIMNADGSNRTLVRRAANRRVYYSVPDWGVLEATP